MGGFNPEGLLYDLAALIVSLFVWVIYLAVT